MHHEGVRITSGFHPATGTWAGISVVVSTGRKPHQSLRHWLLIIASKRCRLDHLDNHPKSPWRFAHIFLTYCVFFQNRADTARRRHRFACGASHARCHDWLHQGGIDQLAQQLSCAQERPLANLPKIENVLPSERMGQRGSEKHSGFLHLTDPLLSCAQSEIWVRNPTLLKLFSAVT